MLVKIISSGSVQNIERTSLLPMWPGFDSRSRRHMWVEFVVVLAPKGSPSIKIKVSKFQFDLEIVKVRATSWIKLKFLFTIIIIIINIRTVTRHVMK